MIVKQEEWDALVNAKDLLEKKYTQRLQDKSEEITKLKDEISKLQKAVKPDEISIYALNYIINSTSGYYNRKNLVWQLKLPQTLKLSGGVTNQIYKILRQLSDKFIEENKAYTKYEIQNLEKKYKEKYNSFYSEAEKLPTIITRKRLLKFLNKNKSKLT